VVHTSPWLPCFAVSVLLVACSESFDPAAATTLLDASPAPASGRRAEHTEEGSIAGRADDAGDARERIRDAAVVAAAGRDAARAGSGGSEERSASRDGGSGGGGGTLHDDGGMWAGDPLDGGSVIGDPLRQCIAASLPAIDESCRACACSAAESCLTTTPACGEACWALFACIADNDCAYSGTACILSNCSGLLALPTTLQQASAVLTCVQPCHVPCGFDVNGDAG
jgi:hypothetical protein